ncbi:MAG: hypothetical protein EXS12_04035 [Phycisphaerales bacterium]|nr:hypothetical protein [Phycisphaerales bacterium]
MRIQRVAFNFIGVCALALSLGNRANQPPVRVGCAWSLPTCPVCLKSLGATPAIHIMDDPKDPGLNGREVRFDSAQCAATFETDRAKFLKPANEQMVGEQLPLYPAINCVVMPDESLTDPNSPNAGKGENIIVGNRLVRTCCGQCTRRVRRDPVKWLAQVDKAIVADQGAKYALKVCVISGAPLPTEPVNVFIGSRLVEVATPADALKAQQNPMETLAKLDAAIAALKLSAAKKSATAAAPVTNTESK